MSANSTDSTLTFDYVKMIPRSPFVATFFCPLYCFHRSPSLSKRGLSRDLAYFFTLYQAVKIKRLCRLNKALAEPFGEIVKALFILDPDFRPLPLIGCRLFRPPHKLYDL